MAPLQRPLAAPVMIFDLAPRLRELREDSSYERSGRLGLTLAKHGRLRLTLVALDAGIEIGTHHADSPMTIQLLEGALSFRVDGEEHRLRQGQVVCFGPGEAHDIRADEESALLLTLTTGGDAAS